MSDEIEKVKQFFISEYRQNGGKEDIVDWDISLLMNEVKNLKEKNELKRQLDDLKKNTTLDNPVGVFKINPVNHSRENAELAKVLGSTVKAALNYYDPPFDGRIIDDQSFERDNNLIRLAEVGSEGSVVILRDNAGRCDMGGPTKWKEGKDLDEKGRWI